MPYPLYYYSGLQNALKNSYGAICRCLLHSWFWLTLIFVLGLGVVFAFWFWLLGHIWRYSGLSPSSVLRADRAEGPLGCEGSNPGEQCARQVPYPVVLLQPPLVCILMKLSFYLTSELLKPAEYLSFSQMYFANVFSHQVVCLQIFTLGFKT